MNSFDLYTYHLFNGLAGHITIVDKLMAFFAKYALELYAILFVIAWLSLPKVETKKRHALIIMGISGIAALLINVVVAKFWFRPRPFVSLPKGEFTQLIPHSVDSSFPSDHTAGSFGFAAGSWKIADLWVQKSFTILAAMVGIARVYVGVHWPTDVIAGAVVGIVSARLVRKYNRLLLPLTNLGLRLFHFGKFTDPAKI